LFQSAAIKDEKKIHGPEIIDFSNNFNDMKEHSINMDENQRAPMLSN
jgi:hypothetical protein